MSDAGAFANRDSRTELKVELHQRLLDLINLPALDKMSREQIQDEIGDIIQEELAKQNHALNQSERKQLVADVLDELLGLGPLEPLLKDTSITDILVNGHDRVFVERFGILEPVQSVSIRGQTPRQRVADLRHRRAQIRPVGRAIPSTRPVPRSAQRSISLHGSAHAEPIRPRRQ